MKTAIVATALLTSLTTTVFMRVADHAPSGVDALWGSTSARALDMGSTGTVASLTRAYAGGQDKGDRLWATAPGKGTRVAAADDMHSRFSPFPGDTMTDVPSPPTVIMAQATAPAPATPDFNAFSGAAPAAGQAPAAASAAPTAPNAATAAQGPQVDETALRYFARQGDQVRLEQEIARLKALYPSWTPPEDPLAVPNVGDPQLDAMWQLYAQGKYAELRKAISDRQAADPAWQIPADLTERLAVAESRERLVNASDLKQFETVVRTAAETPSLLTCSEVDVLWRLGEAFAQTEREERARDVYKYVLDNCNDTNERVATIQKAIPLLSRPLIDQLMATERKDANELGEFEPARLTLARQSVSDAGDDPELVVAQADLNRMIAVSEPNDGSASDAQLLGWYYIRRDNPEQAERWFSLSRDREETAEASQGLALAQVDLGKPGDAEDVLYKYRDRTDEIRAVYQAAVANFIATEPRIAIEPARLKRMADETAKAKDPAAAQQFGWYARDLFQHQTAGEWFMTALRWKPDDEPSAYGLVLTRAVLGDQAGVREIQRLWSGRSERIANLGEDERGQLNRGIPAPTDAPDTSNLTSAYTRIFPQGSNNVLPEARQQQQRPLQQPQPVYPQAQPVYQPQPQASTASRGTEPVVDRYAPAEPIEATRAAPLQEAYSTARTRAASAPRVQEAAPSRAQSASRPRGCSATDSYNQATGQAALSRGWCLMELNRPLEAVSAFERAMQTGDADVQRDAAYGQSLAYLRRNLVDDAAVAAAKAPQDRQRSHQVEVDILTQRASGFFEQKRYKEALLALDQRARITPERTDLMVLRGYAYVNLNRLGDAERVFKAVAASGNREGLKGISVVNNALGRP